MYPATIRNMKTRNTLWFSVVSVNYTKIFYLSKLLSFTWPALTLPGYKIYTGYKPFYVKIIFPQSTTVGCNVWYIQKFCLVPLELSGECVGVKSFCLIAFAKLRKAAVSFIVSLRLSVRPSKLKILVVGIFFLSFILEIVVKPASKIRFTWNGMAGIRVVT